MTTELLLLRLSALSLRRPQIAARKVKHDWNCLRHDKDLAGRYSIEVSNRFGVLQCEEEDITANTS